MHMWGTSLHFEATRKHILTSHLLGNLGKDILMNCSNSCLEKMQNYFSWKLGGNFRRKIQVSFHISSRLLSSVRILMDSEWQTSRRMNSEWQWTSILQAGSTQAIKTITWLQEKLLYNQPSNLSFQSNHVWWAGEFQRLFSSRVIWSFLSSDTRIIFQTIIFFF